MLMTAYSNVNSDVTRKTKWDAELSAFLAKSVVDILSRKKKEKPGNVNLQDGKQIESKPIGEGKFANMESLADRFAGLVDSAIAGELSQGSNQPLRAKMAWAKDRMDDHTAQRIFRKMAGIDNVADKKQPDQPESPKTKPTKKVRKEADKRRRFSMTPSAGKLFRSASPPAGEKTRRGMFNDDSDVEDLGFAPKLENEETTKQEIKAYIDGKTPPKPSKTKANKVKSSAKKSAAAADEKKPAEQKVNWLISMGDSDSGDDNAPVAPQRAANNKPTPRNIRSSYSAGGVSLEHIDPYYADY